MKSPIFCTDFGASRLKQLLMISTAIVRFPLTVLRSAAAPPAAADYPLAPASAAYLAPLMSSPFGAIKWLIV